MVGKHGCVWTQNSPGALRWVLWARSAARRWSCCRVGGYAVLQPGQTVRTSNSHAGSHTAGESWSLGRLTQPVCVCVCVCVHVCVCVCVLCVCVVCVCTFMLHVAMLQAAVHVILTADYNRVYQQPGTDSFPTVEGELDPRRGGVSLRKETARSHLP